MTVGVRVAVGIGVGVGGGEDVPGENDSYAYVTGLSVPS